MMSLKQAMQRCFDRINASGDDEDVNIYRYMDQYKAIRLLSAEEYEKVYDTLASRLGYSEAEEEDEEDEEDEKVKVEDAEAEEVKAVEEVKAEERKEFKMKGTEKQIAWAMEIRESFMTHRLGIPEVREESKAGLRPELLELLSQLEAVDDASWWINNRSRISRSSFTELLHMVQRGSLVFPVVEDKKATAQKVMRRAWELAREGQQRFGGTTRQYIAASLRIAWEEVKSGFYKIKMHYSEYKNDYSGCKTVRDSYDYDTKTIVVLVPVRDCDRKWKMTTDGECLNAMAAV